MTGFIGERTNRTVALVTDDFRVYHELAPFFEQHGITVLGLTPGQEVPPSVQVLVGGPPDDPRSVPLHDDAEANWLAVLSALDPRHSPGEPYRLVSIGLDPGETIGMAVLCDGSMFWTAECRDIECVVRRVAHWRRALEAETWRIQVGDGAPMVGEPLLARLRQAFPTAMCHTVPERASSPTTPVTQSRHTDAAVHIAMREAA